MPNTLPNSGWATRPTVNLTVFGITYECPECNSSVCDHLKTTQDEEVQVQSILDLVILEEKLIADNLTLDTRQALTVTVTQSLPIYLRQEGYEAILDSIIEEAVDPCAVDNSTLDSRQAVTVTITQSQQIYIGQEVSEAILDRIIEEAQNLIRI